MTEQDAVVTVADKAASAAEGPAPAKQGGLTTIRQPVDMTPRESSASQGIDDIFAQIDHDDPDDEVADEFIDPHQNDTFELQLQSIDAQSLWTGMKPTQERKGFPGVEWYARRVGRVCRSVRDDDPYAIMALQDMEFMINKIRRDLNGYLEETATLLGSGSGDGIVYRNPSRRRFSQIAYGVSPTNGYAFAAIQLVGRYDQVVQHSMQARDMGLISSSRLSAMKNRRPFRQLTWSLARYQLSGATRDDFRHATARARNAVEKYGEVTEDVLDPDVELLLMEIKGPGDPNKFDQKTNVTASEADTPTSVPDA